MAQFIKDRAIELIDGGIESYLVGLYGLTLPSVRTKEMLKAICSSHRTFWNFY